jgi:hypothetical protein
MDSEIPTSLQALVFPVLPYSITPGKDGFMFKVNKPPSEGNSRPRPPGVDF